MIHLNDTNQVSEHVRNRSRNMWVRTLAPDHYLVKPKEKGKARRAVRLLQSSGGVYIECSDAVTGKPCQANVKREANRKLKEQQQA